jgi:hypothetical protein
MTVEEKTQEQPLDTIKDLQTRFLYPFFFEDFPKAADALVSSKHLRSDGRYETVWACEKPHRLYTDEVLSHVTSFLFAEDPGTADDCPIDGAKAAPERQRRGGPPACHYLKMTDVVLNRWLKDATLWEDKQPLDAQLHVTLIPDVRVELFLSPQGVGVLSLALTPGRGPFTLDQAKRFNYQIAQFRRRETVYFRKRHPKDDPKWQEKIPANAWGSIKDAPANDAPLTARFDGPGGRFSVQELIDEFLRPLASDGFDLRGLQDELDVYTVARFGPEINLDRLDVRDRLAPFLGALTQVEEVGHAGGLSGSVGAANVILNRRHWAAVGQLGAAHLVIDQPADVEGEAEPAFNENRVRQMRDKYFIPYLMALLQRLVLHRAIRDAGRLGEASEEEAADGLARLRAGLLDFAVRGHFTQVSVREALHRYYQTARMGLDVPIAWEEVRRAVADRDAQNTAIRQRRLAEEQKRISKAMDGSLTHIAEVQRFVHILEYAICSVYFAHLWHMFAGENKNWREWIERYFNDHYCITGAGDWMVSLGVVVFAFLGFGVANVANRLVKRKAHKGKKS